MQDIRYTVENSFAAITYDPEVNCTIFTYKRFGTSEEFRHSWVVAAELGASKKVHKWVSNSLRMEVLRPDDQDWFIHVMAPQLKTISSPTSYIAFIVNENIFNKLSIMNIAKAVKQKQSAVFKYFETEEKGLEWLKRID